MHYNPIYHHRRSIRLKDYDYSKAGLYFITICVHDKRCLFGGIIKGKMVLNSIGEIANECWMEIPLHFPNAVLHEYVVMPNHIHGIIELKTSNKQSNSKNCTIGETIATTVVGAENFLPLQVQQRSFGPISSERVLHSPKSNRNEFQKMIPHSIGSIVKGFKIGVTKWVRNHTDIQTVWQRNYYEHIIRDGRSYEMIANYIVANPKKWESDGFYCYDQL